MKLCFLTQRRPIDQLLKDTIAVFLSFLNDPDLSVRRSALTLFNSVAHNKPVLLKDKLSVLLPLVYKETQIKVWYRKVLMYNFSLYQTKVVVFQAAGSRIV